MPNIKERIKDLRKEYGYTQESLAKALGLNAKSSIANYENGSNAPSDEIKIKMCKIFNCSMDYLMGNSDLKLNSIVDIPQLLYKYKDYINQSHMPKIEYDILTEDEKNILQDMFCNFAKQVNGDNNYVSPSYFKSKAKDERHWRTMYGIYFVYTKYIYDIFSELNSEFSNKYTENTGFAFINVKQNKSEKLFNIPVLGKIAAGQPILAEEYLEGYLPVDPNMYEMTTPDDYFYLKVSGESMNLKIPNGSYALIHKQNYAEDGDIIVALVNGDNEATLKKYKQINENTIALEPMSTLPMDSIYVDLKDSNFKIIGKAIGQFGKF